MSDAPDRAASGDILDPMALERLDFVAQRGDPRLVERLVGLFLDDTPERLRGLHEAFGRQDDVALRAIAHGLRGSSETFGARDMVDHSSFLEDMPPGWDATHIQFHLDALVEAFDRTGRALKSLLAKP